MPALVWFKDTKNNHIRVNRAAAEAVGKPIAEIEGRSAAEVVPDEVDRYYQDDLEVIRSGQPKHGITEQFRIASGETRWLHTNKTPLRDKRGNICGVLAVSVDITERKRAEEELAAAKAAPSGPRPPPSTPIVPRTISWRSLATNSARP